MYVFQHSLLLCCPIVSYFPMEHKRALIYSEKTCVVEPTQCFFVCVLSTHTPVGPMPLLLGKHDCAEGSTAVKT